MRACLKILIFSIRSGGRLISFRTIDGIWIGKPDEISDEQLVALISHISTISYVMDDERSQFPVTERPFPMPFLDHPNLTSRLARDLERVTPLPTVGVDDEHMLPGALEPLSGSLSALVIQDTRPATLALEVRT